MYCNIDILRQWVYYQIVSDDRLKLEIDDNTYHIYYKNKVGHFTIWPKGIIEESINEGDDILFYLHFEFHDYKYACDFFKRMINVLAKEDQRIHEILLCCTGGMTTTFFAQKMNRYCELNHSPYHFNAAGSYHLDDVYQGKELILIAPQLRHMLVELKAKYAPVPIESIEASVFAAYDCPGLLDQIETIL
ncbi:MAG: hypothetical protein LUG12_05925 [Erysipelotrichaceae bacterium]|nr:hypothetical protein [Erysipelotrichaceae bacterium]